MESNLSVFDKLLAHRIVFLNWEIEADISALLCAELLWLDLQNHDFITLYINSPGGLITGLWTIYDTIQQLNSPIKTICMGEAFSSAAVILAAGTPGHRQIVPHGKVMIHGIQVEFLMGGTQADFEEESKRVKEDNQTMMEVLARLSGQSLRKVKRDCTDDKYFSPKEALAYGLVDEIVSPKRSIPELKR